MKNIYIINFDTSQYYENNIGNKYYCKTFHSMIKKLKELLLNDNNDLYITKKQVHNICMKLLLDYKTTGRYDSNIIIDGNEFNLYININNEELF